ncbi:hypothetical protein MYAM1_002854 [Malassezia yamatoensis]|uniref:Zn(2)-C6 fungal-type domain-containing protein n=1 Tax=Malassezia yamatoensis TaxID=253288 RepID=A0AAJ6CHC5_9BASI|nr:hypothetical protein MYAM1_002854 [Malassezia yamatoensis]
MAAAAVSTDHSANLAHSPANFHANDLPTNSDLSSSPIHQEDSHNKAESRDSQNARGNSSKFRCRVAMACVHCRHRKIRCDGAQPSCYTCTRLQRKCEYERVSEHDNLLSRERKRLSRERKAARIAASTPSHHSTNHSVPESSSDEKTHQGGVPQVHLPFQPKAQSPTFTIPVSQMAAISQSSPTDIPTSLMQSNPPMDATIPPAWATSQGNHVKDVNSAWIVPPSITPPGISMPNALSSQQDSLLSLRSTADPSLLELSAAPSSLSTDSLSLMGMSYMDPNEDASSQSYPNVSRPSLSPTDSAGNVPGFADLGHSFAGLSPGSMESESTMVEPMEMNSTLDTPLKLFSDTQQLPSTMATTPSSGDTTSLSEGGSSVFGAPISMNFSPLSPQLAPTAFDGYEPTVDTRNLGMLDANDPNMGLYSTSVPVTEAQFPFASSELAPSSLPAMTCWTQLSNA